MLSNSIYDYALIGAGGAGMLWLLAMHEQRKLQDRQVIIFEPERKVSNDRTWCFWAKPSDAIVQSLAPIIDGSWDRMNTPRGPRSLQPYRYYHVRSALLYQWVKNKISDYSGIHWCSTPVKEVEVTDEGCRVDAGESYTAAQVFDSRLNRDQQAHLGEEDLLWQSFLGYRVQLTEGTFDPGLIDLMDFSIEQHGHCQFMYVLPFNDREALVEMTRFGRTVVDKTQSGLVEDYIRQRWGDHQVLEEEVGRIPMTLALQEQVSPAVPGKYTPIGTAAGAVKPTTGYAFINMYTHAQSLAKALPKGATTAIQKNKRLAFYDQLLLRVLTDQPDKGKVIFDTLFNRIGPGKVFSFLGEKTSLLQELPILAALPPLPFLKAIVDVYIPKPTLKPQPVHVVMLIAIMLLGMQAWSSDAVHVLSQVLLALGLVFPGIPHGAMDHVLSLPEQKVSRKTLPFMGKYVGIMSLVLLLWLFSPAMGLTLFIGYSAWHFGETDFREWRSFNPLPAFLHGMGLLLFILGTHWSAFLPYLQSFGLSAYSLSPAVTDGIPVVGMQLLLIAGTFVVPGRRVAWVYTMLILLLGAFLPLLAAFGLYFIGLHSTQGWMHIKAAHGFSTRKMVVLAAPFSLLAFGGLGVFSALLYLVGYTWATGWPVFFAFLAAISAPHIWYMHQFYQQSPKSQHQVKSLVEQLK